MSPPSEDEMLAAYMKANFPGYETPAVRTAPTNLSEDESAAAYCAAHFGIQAPSDKT
jgi:hypothetical protein